MGIFKRALRSVTRRKGKTIILFLIVFILGNVIAAGVSVKQSTVNLEAQIKEQLGTASTIEPDHEKIEADMTSGVLEQDKYPDASEIVPSLEVINAIGNLPQVNYYDYSVTNYIDGKTIKTYSPDPTMGMGGGFTINSYARNLDALSEEKISIVDGKELTQEQLASDEKLVMISNKVAEENAINVGDEIDMISNIYPMMMGRMDGGGEEQKPYATKEEKFKVVALFEVKAPKETKKEDNQYGPNMDEWRNMELMNTMYTPIGVGVEFSKWNNDVYTQMMAEDNPDFEPQGATEIYYQTKYTLKDPNDLKSFKEDASAYLGKYMKINANSDNYDLIAGPVKKLSSISNYVLIGGTAVSILILTLIIILFLRDRKHELGILLALGESKLKVFQQIFLEVFVVAIIAMTLALFTGNMLAKQVSGGMINTRPEDGMVYYGNIDMNAEDIVEQYEVTFTPQIVLLYYGVGFATILLSTAGPMFYILRLKPKKILM